MANAVRDTETQKVYHPNCAPDIEEVEETDVDGFLCASCGALIEDDDDEDTKTVEEEDDDDTPKV